MDFSKSSLPRQILTKLNFRKRLRSFYKSLNNFVSLDALTRNMAYWGYTVNG